MLNSHFSNVKIKVIIKIFLTGYRRKQRHFERGTLERKEKKGFKFLKSMACTKVTTICNIESESKSK